MSWLNTDPYSGKIFTDKPKNFRETLDFFKYKENVVKYLQEKYNMPLRVAELVTIDFKHILHNGYRKKSVEEIGEDLYKTAKTIYVDRNGFWHKY